MTLGDKTTQALNDPKWLPNDRGDYDCPSCGRKYHDSHNGCPACGCDLRRPTLA